LLELRRSGSFSTLNLKRQRGWLAIHHAIARDSDLEIIELLLDHEPV